MPITPKPNAPVIVIEQDFDRLISIVTGEGNSMQVADPQHVHRFWQWLFVNQDKIGVIIDFKKPKVKGLNKRYRGVKL